MMRFILIILVAAAAWYGWKHWPELMQRTPSNEAVIANHSGKVLTRLRLTVDGQTFVKERLADNEQVVFPFKVANDASFELQWEYESELGQRHWRGGMVPKGPMIQRHFLQFDSDGNIVYEARAKGLGAPPAAE